MPAFPGRNFSLKSYSSPNIRFGLPINVSNPGDPASTFPDFVLWGDTAQNGDAVTAADLALARAILLNQFTPTQNQRLAVDVTPLNENRSRGDGTYDQADYDFLQLVSQFLASF
ncbi:MAG TPA: hypothetical protein PLS70_23275 [Acidobacteriota bacterium]|nr:hypothetical protein [Acidobacteriota bacterium]